MVQILEIRPFETRPQVVKHTDQNRLKCEMHRLSPSQNERFNLIPWQCLYVLLCHVESCCLGLSCHVYFFDISFETLRIFQWVSATNVLHDQIVLSPQKKIVLSQISISWVNM